VTRPELPLLGALIADDPWWPYPSACLAGGGIAHLRVWMLDGQDGHLAVVTETGLGASVTNSIEFIWRKLIRLYPGPLTLLEHYPAAESPAGDGEHVDLVDVTGTHPEWQRIWPTPPSNPAHAGLNTWMSAHGRVILSIAATWDETQNPGGADRRGDAARPANPAEPPCNHRDDWALTAITFGEGEPFGPATADVVCLHPGCRWAGRLPWDEVTVVHQCPAPGSLELPCCGRDVTGVLPGLRITSDSRQVTCPGKRREGDQDG
jgi:hypothetical protein